jgi:2-polyprenyl-3-methyl-5-hydroxy-6-metoxy-1,4-benzoquinol methylase
MTDSYFKFFKCSVCGGNHFNKIFCMGLFSYKHTVSVCKDCGVVCFNPRWDEKKYEEYYRAEYYGGYQPEAIVDRVFSDDGAQSGLKVLNDLGPYVNKDARIIDIGCGGGSILRALKQSGFSNLAGLDPSPDCCSNLQKYGIESINQPLTSWVSDHNPQGEFDCVILNGVIEHFVEPERELNMVNIIMKPGGVLYIEAPDFNSYPNPFSQFTTPHTFYFSKTTLQMLLNNNGFTIYEWNERPNPEFALIAKKSQEKVAFCNSNVDEYNTVMSHLKKARSAWVKVKIIELLRGILGGLISLLVRGDDARERAYLSIVKCLSKIGVIKLLAK